MIDKGLLPKLFTDFSETECGDSSDLYGFLALSVANDDQLLTICSNARVGQPVPNLLFGAVHYLLLKGHKHELMEYYPSIVEEARDYKGAFPYFKEFCLKYTDQVIEILQTKLVQTNEVRRCAYLYPVFCYIHEKTNKPLSLIEIGTSAGLQLLWDKYSYSFNSDNVLGNKTAKLHISSEINGNELPYISSIPPQVSSRAGIDLNIVDLNNEEEYLWLKSLIWTNHTERLNMFTNAAKHIKDASLNLIEGDGVALLEDLATNVPMSSTLCIFHTHVANQMPPDVRIELLNIVKSIGKTRDVFHIYNNIQDRNLHLDYYIDGVEFNHTIAETDGHGRWFTWLLKDEISISSSL